jgi:hypothetical protein
MSVTLVHPVKMTDKGIQINATVLLKHNGSTLKRYDSWL